MIRLGKLTDYGFVVLNRFAVVGGEAVHNAPELAEATGLPLPTVSKVLKMLTRGGLLTARRGARGGYSLARPAEAISAVEIIDVLEGPVALTDCSGHPDDDCVLEDRCPMRGHWMLINDAVQQALQKISLADLARSPSASWGGPLRHQGFPSGASDNSIGCSDGCNGSSRERDNCTCGHSVQTSGDKR